MFIRIWFCKQRRLKLLFVELYIIHDFIISKDALYVPDIACKIFLSLWKIMRVILGISLCGNVLNYVFEVFDRSVDQDLKV